MSEDPGVPSPQQCRQLLEDSSTVLATRQRLDGLALEVLAAPGMGEAQVAALTRFLERDWRRGVAAADRLRCAPDSPRGP